MPSVSKRQRRTMLAAAHDRKFAKKLAIPQKVAREFVAADQAKAKRPGKK
jgi:hypothetical protein